MWLPQCNWEDFERVDARPMNALTTSSYSLAEPEAPIHHSVIVK